MNTIIKRMRGGSERKNWNDWKWHITHSIKDIDTFMKLTGISFSEEEVSRYENTLEKFPLSITPYYLSLIEADDYINDPIFKQSFPSLSELKLSRYDVADPLHEEGDSPTPGITHRYPDRVLFHISNTCAMYCRHCTRKRKVGDIDDIPGRSRIKKGINYIANNPNIRDVLLSGGDPLMLEDQYIDWILSEISSIPHVEVIRIGTRIPVVLPYRITESLLDILKKYPNLWINTHFNHPREMTSSSRKALSSLAEAGIPLGNQTVLLSGINDCPRIIKNLMHLLVKNRVRPYYLYQCDLSEGLQHFRTPVGKGIEIIESLIGHTSGFSIPSYVIDAPGGGGKIPVMPNYLISWSTNKVILRNYEGVIVTYHEPDSYEPIFCDRKCDACSLQLKLNPAEEKSIGVEQLLSDSDLRNSLIPENTLRYQRNRSGNDN